MTLYGYKLVTDWKNSQCGQIAIAQKDGDEYFIKKYQTPVKPIDNGALDAKTFRANKKLFEDFVDYRKRINASIRKISSKGGNIIIPLEEFVFGNNYVEVSEFIEGAVSDDELEGLLTSLSTDVKKLLMLTAAGALVSIHNRGVVHGDLKLKNVLLIRNSSGNFVAKVIDFDNSYFVDEKPTEDIAGDPRFYSPELGKYSDFEDDREELSEELTTKSDIYSLGLIFHFYLSGDLPEAINLTDRLKKKKAKGKPIYCWVAQNYDCDLKISSRIENYNYRSLIEDMLNPKWEMRPTAGEVLKRLQDSDFKSIFEEAWPEHEIMIDVVKLKREGYISLKKKKTARESLYELFDSKKRKKNITCKKLISMGYAKSMREAVHAEPWADHAITIDKAKLRNRGFVSSEQKIKAGIKGYESYRADSTSHFFTLENLIGMGYAVRTKPAIKVVEDIAKPWSQHNIIFNERNIRAKGFTGLSRAKKNGVLGYELHRSDGTKQFLLMEIAVVMKLAEKI